MPSCAERAALLAAALLACSVASPETEVKEALAALREAELPAGGPAALRLERVEFGDVTAAVDGARAHVFAVVEAEGTAIERRAAGGGPRLAYVGREEFAMDRCAARRWCVAGLPALEGVVAALRGAPRPAGARVVAWQVRVERDRAVAGEDYEEGGRRLRLTRELARDGRGWRLAAP